MPARAVRRRAGHPGVRGRAAADRGDRRRGATLTGGTPDPRAGAGPGAAAGDGRPGRRRPRRARPPRVAGCGLEFPYLPVRPDAVARARVDAAAAAAARASSTQRLRLGRRRADGARPGLRARARRRRRTRPPARPRWASGCGWSPAGCCPATALGVHGAPGRRDRTARPLLDCTVTAAGGLAVGATVAGHVVPVARGEIAVSRRSSADDARTPGSAGEDGSRGCGDGRRRVRTR